jgi:hypothetical protein
MIRKIIKKLNNFKFTSLIAMIISSVSILYAIFSFAFFHYAGDLLENENYIRAVGFYDKPNGGFLSLLVFLCAFLSLILSIVVVYGSWPFVKNQEKQAPRKNNLFVGFISGILQLGLVILMIALLGEKPHTATGIIITLPFGILSMIGQLLYLFPYITCNFYMPEINRK